MQPIRQIVENMPAFFQVPPEVQHQRVEIIMWPLESDAEKPAVRKKVSIASLVGAAGYTGARISIEDMDVARFAEDTK
ncbi:MAG: hypothetical protein KJ614_03755 [Gammaproteobacteria bacterium]|uniref:hypothetical protein n=1 Tax=Rhodoferax sp. TaxID=50421 RepID=UPI00181731CE|nr:hypothetical protein [Rhodoferax sp.]MBU3898033.1 hypothetical protein [Gammaproteobacteria bacterium]MBA3058532.1 hypothetical protein [Rhodoferax sp.]MBU3999210.1 hypothetical protein [Gammaproteobacteria bacterium]MBU4081773.1 hypothetical protein [Gammaproteobacteria bacterium]MBU4112891.1 hypothetical protein [Gammaproteobacteria bacterium]